MVGDIAHWRPACRALALVDCVSACSACEVCGNGTCAGDEDCDSCAEDCGCDDDNGCTADRCVPAGGGAHACAHQPSPGCCGNGLCDGEETCASCPADCGCDDADACTRDRCGAGGVCEHRPVVCDDRDDCTIDACDGAGACTFTPRRDGSSCGCGGTCQAGGCANDAPCDDANPCTIDACGPDGRCVHTPNPGASCGDDGDPCTVGQVCDAAGVCEAGCDVCLPGTRELYDPTCGQPDARCAGGRMCHRGVCGDAWCDHATEDHASCPVDCFESCYGHEALCARTLPEVTLAATHNANVSSAYGFPPFNLNQITSLTAQLQDGIRMLFLDIDYCVPDFLGGGGLFESLCLCHGDEQCALGALPLEVGLAEINNWMVANPSEIVFLSLEQRVVRDGDTENPIRDALEDAGLGRFLYDAPDLVGIEDDCDLSGMGAVWPWSLNNMARRDKRLMVFGAQNLNGQCLVARSAGAHSPQEPSDCFKDEPIRDGQLYQLSHLWGSICEDGGGGCLGDFLTSYCANTLEATMERVESCEAELAAINSAGWIAPPRVNFLVVDFYNEGPGPLAAVEALNGLEHIDAEFNAVCGEIPSLLPCFTDGDCASDRCVNGFCADCERNADCRAGQFCDPAIKLCWDQLGSGAPCVEDDNCQSGQCNLVCDGCLANSDCADGEFCGLSARCQAEQPAGRLCFDDSWCASGDCRAGFCAECSGHGDCAASEHCDLLGVCRRDLGNGAPCGSNAACESDICFGGVCVECTTNTHCASSEYCLVGACVATLPDGAPCTSDVECQGDCNGVVCMECDRDSDCGDDAWCSLLSLGCDDKLGNNSFCLDNNACASGICAGLCVECLTNSDCDGGEFCDAVGNCQELLDNGAPCLANDADCKSGHCSSFLFCVECKSNDHCPSSQFCEVFTGTCRNDLNNLSACTGNAQCKSGACCGVCLDWCF